MFAPRIGFGTRYWVLGTWHWILASESGAWLANRRVVKFYNATKPSTRLTGDQLKKWPLFDCLSSGLTCFLWPIRQFSTCQLWLPQNSCHAGGRCANLGPNWMTVDGLKAGLLLAPCSSILWPAAAQIFAGKSWQPRAAKSIDH